MDQIVQNSVENFVEKHTKRNFRLGVINGVLFYAADTLMDPTLVLASFIGTLTSSPLLIGLLIPIRDGAWALPQLWVSGYLQSHPLKIEVYKKISIIRICCWAILALTINFITGSRLLLLTFLLTYTLSSLASGLSGLPFLEIVGKTIPDERRGEFFAWRLGLGGLAGIASSFIVKWVLGPSHPFKYPQNYGVLVAAFFIISSLSLLFFNRIFELPDTKVKPRANFNVQIKNAWVAFKLDREYRKFLFSQSALSIGGCATPFFAWYTQNKLGSDPGMIGIYLAFLTGSNLISNYLYGRLSRKTNNTKVMKLCIIAGILMTGLVLALAILAQLTKLPSFVINIWLIPVFVLAGLRNSGVGISLNSLLLDISPPSMRSLYVGFANTFLGLVLVLTSFSGLFIAKFGFILLVCLTIASHVFALINIPVIKPVKNEVFLPEEISS